MLLVLFVTACLGLCRLGWWQLDRAAEKRERYDAFMAAHEQEPIAFELLSDPAAGDYLWRRTTTTGRYQPLTFLLDNRSREGRPGYEVLSPLVTTGGRSVLIHRGWLMQPPTRAQVPALPAPDGSVTVSGYFGPEPVVGLKFSEAADQVENLAPGIWRMQRVDLGAIGDLAGARLWPDIIYLDAEQTGAFAVDRKLPGDGSAKHHAYAVQWFAMATVLAFIGLWNLKYRNTGKTRV